MTVFVLSPEGVHTSTDGVGPVTPWWAILLPPAVGIALALALPPKREALPARVTSEPRWRASTLVLLGLAVAFPLVVGMLGLGGTDWYVLLKFALFMVVPAIVVAAVRGVRVDARRAGWRWWAPAVAVLAWFALAHLAPWVEPVTYDDYDIEFVIIAAVATAITAGIGEELFYRKWLQTRLEAGLGAWAGIAVTTVAFALMHLASHSTGQPLLDVATVLVSQGSFGLLAGILWWRYRNLLAVIVMHLLSNGWSVLAYLLG